MPSSTELSRTETLTHLTISIACFGILANVFQGDGNPVTTSLAFSGLAFSFTYCLIRWMGNKFISAGLKGTDMSKAKRVDMYVLHRAWNSNFLDVFG
jgi:UDP-N-acetylglucosamine--dolichyl-phosphate N-acetylglucosaminephosphotransferase